MKLSSRPSRTPSQVSDSLHRQLNMYALAASAAGVGVLVNPPAAEGKIVYTPAHVQLQVNKPYPIDLDHNGKADFFLLDSGFASFSAVFLNLSVCHTSNPGASHACVSSTFATNALNEVRLAASGNAAALPAGAKIQKANRFGGKNVRVGMGMVDFKTVTSTKSYWGGPWVDGGKGVKNRYLGLKFEINGKFHFGWARLTVATQKRNFTATLSGYAYETIAGKAILAGKTKGPDVVAVEPATLGRLALGRK